MYHSAAIQEVFTLLILAWKRTVYFEEGIFNAERANSMIGQIIQTRPRHLLLATITKEEVDWEANIFVFRTGHQRTFVKRICLLTNIFVFRLVRYQSILRYDWRINLLLLVTHTMIENIFFEGCIYEKSYCAKVLPSWGKIAENTIDEEFHPVKSGACR